MELPLKLILFVVSLYVPPLTNVLVSVKVIPLIGLYSTSPVLLFLTNISVVNY